MNGAVSIVPKHHIRQAICATRKIYRDGRRDTAVKVYTISQESRYIMVVGVPAVGASDELVKLCALYGQVDEYRIIDEYPDTEPHTEVYWIKFSKIRAARVAKRKLDDNSFFGGILHVFFSPESETLEDTRQKLAGRRRWVAAQIIRQKVESQRRSEDTPPTPFIDVIEPTEKRRSNNASSELVNQKRVNGHVQATSVAAEVVRNESSRVEVRKNRPNQANHMQGGSHLTGAPPYHPSMSPGLMSYPSNQYMGAPHSTSDDTHTFRRRELNFEPHSEQNNNRQSTLRDARVSSVSNGKRNNPGRRESPSMEESPTLAEGEQLIHGVKIKPYLSKSIPKFIPRQIRTEDSATSISVSRKTDYLDEMIKKNAYILGPIAGPFQRPGVPSEGLSKEEVSLEKTRAAIREKLKTFCPTLLPRQLRKRKKPETEVPFTSEVP